MDPVSSHFDELFYTEPTQLSDPLWPSLDYDEAPLKPIKTRMDPMELEDLQSLFTMASGATPSSISTMHHTMPELPLDNGIPTNVSLQQFAHNLFEESLNTPSLSTSMNSTPISDLTPLTSAKQSIVEFAPDSESSVLFPSVMAMNPEIEQSSTLGQGVFLPSADYTSQPVQPRNLSVQSSPYNTYSAYDSPEQVPTLLTHTEPKSVPSISNTKFKIVKTKSKSISGPSTRNETASSSSSRSRNSLDSRLSLIRLGEILGTKNQDETIAIEKYILKVFGQDLGFPLGFKTWIRDTSEGSRQEYLDKLEEIVRPKYPQLDQELLERVIRRATYSMMQGRLRKERRAASKRY